MVEKTRNGRDGKDRTGGQVRPAGARRPAGPATAWTGGGLTDKRRRDPLPAISFLKGTDLWSAYQRLSALEKDLREIQPRLDLKPLKLANQVLVVTAGSPAVAARVRQFEPSLVEGLRARGWLVGRIRFRPIAVHDIPRPPPTRVKEPVSQAALKELETLDATEMNAELRAALSSFVRRQKSYLGS